jgi:hypothetical protein
VVAPYRASANVAHVPPWDGRCDNCGAYHVPTWHYGRGDGSSWWGYSTWFMREVPTAHVGCQYPGYIPRLPRGIARLRLLLHGTFSRLSG